MPACVTMRAGGRLARCLQCCGTPQALVSQSRCMALISELSYPTKWYGKVVTATLTVLVFALLGAVTIAAFLVYHIVFPAHSRSDIDTKDFPGRPDIVSFTVPDVGSREGWFFPGLRGAPTIILCHGYQSQRGELLTLVTALQDHQYNVFAFDFAAHGSSSGYSTLGYRETDELRAAIAALARRDDVDRTRFGLWGTDIGAYAAIAAAEADPRVRALVADSVYDQPAEMARLQVERSGLGNLPLTQRLARVGFLWLNRPYRHEPPLSQRLSRLEGVAKLYISASDDPELARSTGELFLHSPPPREQVILAKGNYSGMMDDEKRSYENRIVSFFLVDLPPSRPLRR